MAAVIDIFPSDSVNISEYYHNTNFGTANQLFTGEYLTSTKNRCKPDVYLSARSVPVPLSAPTYRFSPRRRMDYGAYGYSKDNSRGIYCNFEEGEAFIGMGVILTFIKRCRDPYKGFDSFNPSYHDPSFESRIIIYNKESSLK